MKIFGTNIKSQMNKLSLQTKRFYIWLHLQHTSRFQIHGRVIILHGTVMYIHSYVHMNDEQQQGVQRRMVLVVNIFEFLELNFIAL